MVENAEAITLSGQLVNKWTSISVENYLKQLFDTNELLWIAGDTDSCYFTIKPFMDTVKETDIQKKVDTANRFCEEIISPFIKDKCQALHEYMNCYEQKMNWGREVIADKAIWVAKKKYVMSVWDSEYVRFDEPKIKLTGLEAVRSSTPGWAQKLLKECYTIALFEEESAIHSKLEQIQEDFGTYSVNDIAIPRGINNINKYYDEDHLYKSGTPKHVKAALVHNKLIEDLGLVRIPKITDGDKIKFIELKKPNPTGQEVVAFDTYMPKEFGLEKYVDRDLIFEKSFLSALRLFLDAINWKEEERIDLFDF